MQPIVARARKPRCAMLYAMAPEAVGAAAANRAINALIALPDLPRCVWHDHFIGAPGGVAIFDIRALGEFDALAQAARNCLAGWRTELRPLIFSHNPAAFDEQIAYTLSAYGGADWDALRKENRPVYVDPAREADSASDD